MRIEYVKSVGGYRTVIRLGVEQRANIDTGVPGLTHCGVKLPAVCVVMLISWRRRVRGLIVRLMCA